MLVNEQNIFRRSETREKKKSLALATIPDLFLRFIFLLLLLYFVPDELESDSDSDESEINLILRFFVFTLPLICCSIYLPNYVPEFLK
jgi:hypothetical protein